MPNLRESLSYEPVELGFGTSGLRALVKDMTDLECYINTAGFLAFLRGSEMIKAGDTVYLAGDLRDSTPRIEAAVRQAVADGGYGLEYAGRIPTPALALRALQQHGAGIMVTGSHIPADRNGIKFYKPDGEVLKPDETAIKGAVATVRAKLYESDFESAAFAADGSLKESTVAPEVSAGARQAYLDRYTAAFAGRPLAGKQIVFYQHSAVGRDDLVELLGELGANVLPVGRSETFIPIDSENVTPDNRAYFRQVAAEHPDMFAMVSTDGDSDRPFVIDERGEFNRGDVLGAVVAVWLKADFGAYTVSSNDAADTWLAQHHITAEHSKIGSPYVIAAMDAAQASGKRQVVGWEANGGFLIGSEVAVGAAHLSPLPTRDAILPIIIALVAAVERKTSVSAVFAELPRRETGSGLINDFPVEVSRALVARYGQDTPETRLALQSFFTPENGFGTITGFDTLDGIKLQFDSGDTAHIRPSGNAPQLRIYSVADTQARADEIVALALAEPDGILRRMQHSLED